MKQVIQLINPRNIFLTPHHRLGSDIYLVSYPRSGNTWLRFLISNAIKTYHNLDRDVNFFSIVDIIPDIHVARYIAPTTPFNSDCFPRIIKSHCSYNPYYQRVILLVRDPKDAVTSYYYHLLANQVISPSLPLSKFIRSRKFGVWAWQRHTNSWLKNCRRGQNVQIFLYENLLQETSIQLGKIMQIIGFDLNSDMLDTAVKLSSADQMRDSESRTISTLRRQDKSHTFVRVAKAQRGSELNAEDKIYIEKITHSTVTKLKGFI